VPQTCAVATPMSLTRRTSILPTRTPAYGGMSFVIFPVEGESCLVAMGIGTQGLAPDEAILGRPGHSRKLQAISTWLNYQYGGGDQVAWAKQDPTRVDIDVPESIQRAWSAYERVFKRYGRVLYALYKPTADRTGTVAALTAMLDLMFEERGQAALKEFQDESIATRPAWFSHLMPKTDNHHVVELLKNRRFVVLQGPPGTGKTRMARQILAGEYGGFGRSVHSIPALPTRTSSAASRHCTAAEVEKVGSASDLLQSRASFSKPPLKPRMPRSRTFSTDLGKILGEAIYLFEASPESRREIDLPYDFGQPFHQQLFLPDNLHVLGTMNSADRSIAIVDVAVRRRFAFLSLWPSLDVVQEHGCPLTPTRV
jgi:5-methylcytosine-specific restriction enzyme B